MNVARGLGGTIARRAVDGRCGLLVSVRDETEAVEALAGGATIVDVKEPTHGPLGAAAGDVTARIAAAVDRRAPWTLACGELADGVTEIHRHVRDVVGLVAGLAARPAAAKAGLAAAAGGDWRRLLAAFAAGLPPGVEPVAVAYADWTRAGSPPPAEVIAATADAGYGVLLLDTFDKAGPAILAGTAGRDAVAAWIAAARGAGLGVVVAGGLDADTLPAALACGPDVVAVRSAACVGGRFGTVSGKLVRRLGKLCGLPGAMAAAEPTGDGK